ncbi:Ale2p SCDLUD_002340 [Saccharomycodes ludwigii]|uniref:Ale2p n=1 Tax=Saccharomycodes ludwigii TaxID=36035 RepID=UPI001E8570C1|nr:hypothetical protein SCDLUD_002340 [Saccharomycodes ludwigii]KAH3900882.1 hypothetical protein SCDLUD_002340 [Saccharomycodes ludwigii]
MINCLIKYILSIPKPSGTFYPAFLAKLTEYNILTSELYLANLHTILYVAGFYELIFIASDKLLYPILHKLKKINKDAIKESRNQINMHSVSFIQSLIILQCCFNAIFQDGDKYWPFSGFQFENSAERVFGYSEKNEIVCIFAIGYFMWDILISILYSTFPFVIHGLISFTVYSIGSKPYINYYASIFLFFELSNPFLNIRWFALKYELGRISKFWRFLVDANDLLFMVTFFLCRIVWGLAQICILCYDFYIVKDDPRFLIYETMFICLGNFVLDGLNLMWFGTMIKIAFSKLLKNKSVKKD